MVLVTMGLLSSEAGMDGNGKVVSDQSAEECEKWDPFSQRLYLRYLGCNSCSSSLLLFLNLNNLVWLPKLSCTDPARGGQVNSI